MPKLLSLPEILTAGFLCAVTGPALAAPCETGNFSSWLDGVRQEAAEQGVSRAAIRSGLSGVGYDKRVISRDRRQGVFSDSFLTFSDKLISKNRRQHGAARIKKYARTFQQIENQYGVPAPVLTAFWGLETDFGAFQGDFKTIQSLATLAYDCRRPDLFRPQLIAALKLIDRGDLSASEMVGAWAGEIGQLQFLPGDYLESAVDFDGDGRRDLRKSAPDALASAANVIAKSGWRAGEPWLEEVRVPQSMPWEQADIAIQQPRSQWAKWGVRRADGGKLKADGMQTSLLLPMGRNGPAFLAYPNFQVYLQWNESLVYTTTAAYFATRLAGAPPVSRGNAPDTLNAAQSKELQKLLVRLGHDVGKIDGIIGAKTRAAVKAMQIKYGMPADSYPTAELLRRLRQG
ncbi:MAG TPA: lytic murein transglycosylase [Afifellaceae bacterium]|nr:lytic murein transglycosylase [Afifellaceae bacterium]